MKRSRRGFFSLVTFFGIGLFFLPFLRSIRIRFFSVPTGDGVWIDGFLFVRDQGKWRVLEGYCPHMGCRVYRREEGIVCPCHGSAFQIDGKRVGGPSPRSLRSYLTFPVGKKIVVLYL